MKQMGRPFCLRCSKPARLCLCSRLKSPPLDNPIPVTILQHALERTHPLNSTRVAKLGLRNLDVVPVTDVNFRAQFLIRPLNSHPPIRQRSHLSISTQFNDPAHQSKSSISEEEVPTLVGDDESLTKVGRPPSKIRQIFNQSNHLPHQSESPSFEPITKKGVSTLLGVDESLINEGHPSSKICQRSHLSIFTQSNHLPHQSASLGFDHNTKEEVPKLVGNDESLINLGHPSSKIRQRSQLSIFTQSNDLPHHSASLGLDPNTNDDESLINGGHPSSKICQRSHISIFTQSNDLPHRSALLGLDPITKEEVPKLVGDDESVIIEDNPSRKYSVACSPSCIRITILPTAKPNITRVVLDSPVGSAAVLNGFVVAKLQHEESRGSSGFRDFEEFELTVPPGSALLYPSEKSISLEAVDFEVKQLFVLDGTWGKARRMYCENPWLQLLPHLKLEFGRESLYSEVRHEPKPGCLSTIESIVCAMKGLGGNVEGLDNLLDVFESMVEDQRRCKEEKFRALSPVIKVVEDAHVEVAHASLNFPRGLSTRGEESSGRARRGEAVAACGGDPTRIGAGASPDGGGAGA